MEKEIFKFSGHLGFNNPYYFTGKDEELIISQGFEEVLKKHGGPLSINPAVITSVLNKKFVIGDHTILKNILRTPWMSYPNDQGNKWIFHELPPHLEQEKTEKEIANDLFHLLCEEIEQYIKGKTKIGVLLSGGMDSRILAACLDHVIKNRKTEVETVVAYTWGLKGSRDVEYALRIAEIFGWIWKHYPVTANHMWNNILIAGERGCEFSGFHLHAMPQIADDNSVDVILAGSYGDSVGRAEYSGKKVSNLSPIGQNLRNPASLIKKKTFLASKKKNTSGNRKVS